MLQPVFVCPDPVRGGDDVLVLNEVLLTDMTPHATNTRRACAEVAEKYLKKGSKVYIEGALQTRKWTGNDGNERYSTEVVLQRYRGELTMLDGRSGASGDKGASSEPPDWDEASTGASSNGGGNGGGNGASGAAGTPLGGDLDDEIPF